MRLTAILTCLLLATGAPLANAATDSAKKDSSTAAKEKAATMSPEDKAAAQKKAKGRWDSMTPEQKAEGKKRYGGWTSESAATKGEKKPAATPPADLPPPSTGPR